jgi:nucleotide-binding universal stress UspA family protein
MEIVLLQINVIPAPTFEPYTSPLTPQPEEIKVMLADEKNYLKTTCAKLEQEGLRVTYLLSDGMVAETIVEVAEVEQADLIAMSTHGRTGILRLLLGSVTEQVVHRSKIPVLLIRPAGE